jgi:hypothetical protein
VRRRRTFEVFTLSFLDCICCGFGAVILFYTIVSARAGVVRMEQAIPAAAQERLLEEQVQQGQSHLAALRDLLERTREQAARAVEETNQIAVDLEKKKERISTYDAETLARRERIEKLQSDVRSLEEGARRMQAGSDERAAPGEGVLGFRASGAQRHYITGLVLHGRHILILLDTSASMLHEDLVSILRLRAQDDAHKRQAAKWRRAVLMVSWLLTQVPPGSDLSVYTFNTRALPLLPDSAGHFVPGGDATQLARMISALQQLVPDGGTSLFNAFAATRTFSPLPDQIVLITDGLPTQGKTPPKSRYVDEEARMRLFDESVSQLPAKVEVDCVLLPMQGDNEAPHRFWELARLTDGTFLMPAKDWP